MKRVSLIGLVLLSACARSQPTAAIAAPAPPPDAAQAASSLDVTIDGKPVAIAEAYIKKLPVDGRYQVFATTKSSSCRELLDNLFNRRDGEETLLFNIGERLAADGTMARVVTDMFIRGSGEVAPGSRAAVAGSAEAGGKVEVTVAFTGTGSGRTVAVRGAIAATGCGARPADTDGVPRASHPSTAAVTFAGKRVPLAGAIRRGDLVLLSTAPKDCSPMAPAAAVVLERRGGAWSARGEWLGRTLSNRSMISRGVQEETKDLAVSAGAAGNGPDGRTVELRLAGAGMIEGYPVALEGTIEAIDCLQE